ncbi:MAG: glycerol kinase GlpK [Coriobacteriia bacterium]|nr:glycerol kinase GlpK [Coriobacteriia bacterium]
MRFVLALDQGTTSSRAIVFDELGEKRSQVQIPLPLIFPAAGWVEQDPGLMWENQLSCARRAIAEAGLTAADMAALGITNQRETTIVWDRVTGKPLHNAIVWQDRRTTDVCDGLLAAGHGPAVRAKTGLPIDPYFSATKIAWILDNVAGARERAEAGELAFGTVDTWFLWQLTAGAVHATDVTNASRTLLYNLDASKWDAELLALFNVPAPVLPNVVASSEIVGHTAPGLFDAEIPIASLIGDQQAALVGNGCFEAGDAKATFGTGIFALMHTGRSRASSETLATTVAASSPDALEFALEGSIFMGGAVVQWVVEGLKLADSPQAAQALAESVPDSHGVVFVPALTGLGAPNWDPLARGAIFGLTRGATDAHVARAAMEAIPLQLADLMEAMISESGHPLHSLRADGGVTVNTLVMQTLADVLGIEVASAQMAESTALGAAYLAGRAVGVWSGPEDLPMLRGVARIYEPARDPDALARLADLKIMWAEAVRRSLKWEQPSRPR